MHDRSLGVAAASEREQQAWYGALLEGRLNYTDLNLVPQREANDLRTSRHSHSYARIEFQNLREAPVRSLGGPAPSRVPAASLQSPRSALVPDLASDDSTCTCLLSAYL
ncbi:Insulin Receptor Substrate 1 [Manis pentadactyla]|nr:Insulin Receptor Substrate 1 [Manis pentadactyla]